MIRPISRDIDTNTGTGRTHIKETLKENKVTPPLVNRNNKVNKLDKELNNEKKKETLIIEKDPLVVPIESWKENNTQV